MFELPEFNLIDRYSNCLKTMYMVSFYSTIIPIGIAWGIGTLLVQYWVDKVKKKILWQKHV